MIRVPISHRASSLRVELHWQWSNQAKPHWWGGIITHTSPRFFISDFHGAMFVSFRFACNSDFLVHRTNQENTLYTSNGKTLDQLKQRRMNARRGFYLFTSSHQHFKRPNGIYWLKSFCIQSTCSCHSIHQVFRWITFISAALNQTEYWHAVFFTKYAHVFVFFVLWNLYFLFSLMGLFDLFIHILKVLHWRLCSRTNPLYYRFLIPRGPL